MRSIILNPWQSLLLLSAGTYGVFCLSVALRQNRLLYFPQRLTDAAAREVLAACNLTRWPQPEGAEYRGVMKEPAPGNAVTNGTVLVFHGNAGGAHEREYYCDTFQRLGWRVILAEYPGYAARDGKPGEVAFREDGCATARLVRKRYPGRLVILGESLGSAVAASVAADPEVNADAVILATPWDKMLSVATYHYPWLPVRLFLRDRYDSTSYLRNYGGAVTLIMAEDDEIVPRRSTLALYEGLPHADRKRLVTAPHVGHNEWFWQITDDQWREILSFSALCPQ